MQFTGLTSLWIDTIPDIRLGYGLVFLRPLRPANGRHGKGAHSRFRPFTTIVGLWLTHSQPTCLGLVGNRQQSYPLRIG